MLSFLLSALLFQPTAPPLPSPHHPGTAACAGGINRGLPANLAGWRDPVAADETVRPGIAVIASTAAPLTLEIERAGTYGVAIDQGAWIDVARDGNVLRSTAHGQGPACSTIRKIVDFALEPGRYVITFSRTQAASLRLLVVRH